MTEGTTPTTMKARRFDANATVSRGAGDWLATVRVTETVTHPAAEHDDEPDESFDEYHGSGTGRTPLAAVDAALDEAILAANAHPDYFDDIRIRIMIPIADVRFARPTAAIGPSEPHDPAAAAFVAWYVDQEQAQ